MGRGWPAGSEIVAAKAEGVGGERVAWGKRGKLFNRRFDKGELNENG